MKSPAAALQVALVSMKHRENDIEFNLAQHEKWLHRATKTGAQFIGFPEFSLTGWISNVNGALSLDSASVLQVQNWAEQFNVAIGTCMVERQSTKLYNTCIVASPGAPLRFMRKINLINKEAVHYTRGTEIPVFEVAGCRMGIAICADASNFEMFRLPALQGAEVIFSPHANSLGIYGNSPAGWLKWRSERWPLYARDCGVAILGVNNAGLFEKPVADEVPTKYCGGAAAIDWNGQAISRAMVRRKRECLITATINLAELRANRENSLSREFQAEIVYNRKFPLHDGTA